MEKLSELVHKAESDLRKLQVSKLTNLAYIMQDDGQRKERELQADLDRLAGIKTSASATKRSKNEQMVCALLDRLTGADPATREDPVI